MDHATPTILAERLTSTPVPVVDCAYGGRWHPPAVIFHGGKGWCSNDCQRWDRGHEVTVWRFADRTAVAA